MFGPYAADFANPSPLVAAKGIGSPGLKPRMPPLYFKLETGHRTGSYKDRFAAAAIAEMQRQGQHTCVASSSGNTGAALAAYCAAAGIRCRIAIVETAPCSKLTQMLAYGAEIFRVYQFGLDPAVTEATFQRLSELGSQAGHALQISAFCYSPAGMRGVETISREILQQLPEVAHVFAPAGGGGLSLAIARGIDEGPAVHVVQPEGNDTIASALRDGKPEAQEVKCTTKISGLQVPSVVDGHATIQACRATGGTGVLVSDEEIWTMQRRLAREQGIFTEPAGAVAAAGAAKAIANGTVGPSEPVVCLVTGSGFKDLESAERMTSGDESPLIALDEIQ